MKNYLKNTFYAFGIFYCLFGTLKAMEIEHPDESTTNLTHKFEKLNIDDPHDLIYKLLTLKAEYLGEDLHREIEKIKPYIYEKIKEEDIRCFIKTYEKKLTNEQKHMEHLIPSILMFDRSKKNSSLDLLIATSYFPKEYYCVPGYINVSKLAYVHDQLIYSYINKHYLAFSSLRDSWFSFTNDIEQPPFFFKDEEDEKYDYEKYVVKLKVKNIIYSDKEINYEDPELLLAYYKQLEKRVQKYEDKNY